MKKRMRNRRTVEEEYDEEDIYCDGAEERLLEDDEINGSEAGFVRGFNGA